MWVAESPSSETTASARERATDSARLSAAARSTGDLAGQEADQGRRPARGRVLERAHEGLRAAPARRPRRPGAGTLGQQHVGREVEDRAVTALAGQQAAGDTELRPQADLPVAAARVGRGHRAPRQAGPHPGGQRTPPAHRAARTRAGSRRRGWARAPIVPCHVATPFGHTVLSEPRESPERSGGRRSRHPAAPALCEGVQPMGRGRAKAKQTKVARELKYSSPTTDFDALQQELSSGEDPFSRRKDDDDPVDAPLRRVQLRRALTETLTPATASTGSGRLTCRVPAPSATTSGGRRGA